MKPKKALKKHKAAIESIVEAAHQSPRIPQKLSCFDCKESFCCQNKKEITISDFEKEFLGVLITPAQQKRAEAAQVQKGLTGHYTCPFLEEGKCSIYEYRPLSCAGYFVVSPQQNCEPREAISDILNAMVLFEHVGKSSFVTYAKGRSDILDIFKGGLS